MQTTNERPICHRSEDLVTYLYHEASAAEAQEFASHVETCEACRAEFAVFGQVHDSILLWRNEALGAAFNPASRTAPALADATTDSRHFVQHERKLPALAALREFFSVAPLWLRGATALAALLLCVLGVLAIFGSWNQRVQVANNSADQNKYTETQFKNEVAKQVEKQVSDFKKSQTQSPVNVVVNNVPKTSVPQTSFRRELASNRALPRSHGLTRAEREQLLADLRLTPGRDDEELPFVFPDEPN